MLGAISPEVSSLEARRSNITPCSIVSEAVAMEGNGREIAAAREAKKQKAKERERERGRHLVVIAGPMLPCEVLD